MPIDKLNLAACHKTTWKWKIFWHFHCQSRVYHFSTNASTCWRISLLFVSWTKIHSSDSNLLQKHPRYRFELQKYYFCLCLQQILLSSYVSAAKLAARSRSNSETARPEVTLAAVLMLASLPNMCTTPCLHSYGQTLKKQTKMTGLVPGNLWTCYSIRECVETHRWHFIRK